MSTSDKKPEDADKLEQELAEQLTRGPLEDADLEKRAKARLSPKYEIRIQTEHDPIVEETKLYRGMAEEVDDRYDRYMNRVKREDGAKD